MTYQKSLITGALTGAALALAFVAWPVNAKPMDPPPPQSIVRELPADFMGWGECVDGDSGACISGGDDTLSWDDFEYEARIVQRWVNDSIIYVSQLDFDVMRGLPLPGYWYGDCDDYALTMRRKLIEWGAPPDALRLVILHDGLAGMHAALMVYTSDAGVFVLDPLRARHRSNLVYNRPPLHIYTLEEYLALPDVTLLYVYSPRTGNLRMAGEFWGGELARKAARAAGAGQ